MANKDNETRALLDALCVWLVEDARFMPEYVNRLRDRFETAVAPRGLLHRAHRSSDELPTKHQ